MVQINLLPWREQERKAKKIQFLITLAGFVGLILFLVLILHCYYDVLISNQKDRNAYLQAQLDEKHGQLRVLKQQKKTQAALQNHLQFLMELRAKSFRAVRLLNMLSSSIPEAVSLIKVIRQGNKIKIEGNAQSDLQITQFMKNISNTAGFKDPILSEITTQKSTTGEARHFQLEVTQQDVS